MFYTLGKILSQTPRQAEQTDTRQEIRRHDPDQQRRKKGETEDEAELLALEDDTTVSITALRAFLQEFLKSLPPEQREGESQDGNQENMPEKDTPKMGHDFNKERPVNGAMAQATGAYKTAAQSGHEDTKFKKGSAQETAENLGLDGSEIRTIHTLINDLKALSAQGYEELVLERNATFLQSLVAAVDKLKGGA
ncbi:MAG: hypothetical protein KDJ35_05200 [Alphaproteobacteria bacterium]|nr:hypothetical protein [Alphaproteobacteria bacterium]